MSLPRPRSPAPLPPHVGKTAFCAGCGVCAALCPVGALRMERTVTGELRPALRGSCTGCGRCVRVCSFRHPNREIDDLAHRCFPDLPVDPVLGHVRSCHDGFADPERQVGASGGLLTRVLKELFRRDLVDGVLCVLPDVGPRQRFAFAVITDEAGLASSAGSVYEPVAIADALRHVLSRPGRYAVTGLPCLHQAIRRAQQAHPVLAERIVCCLGLTCGQLKTVAYADYLAGCAGWSHPPVSVRYRCLDPGSPASAFHHELTAPTGQGHRFPWQGLAGRTFSARAFTPRACSYCDDVFAETADAVFMDAWLPRYRGEPGGRNLVVSRSAVVTGILDSLPHVARTDAATIAASSRGAISVKREGFHLRVERLRARGLRGRFAPRRLPAAPLPPIEEREILLKERILGRSRRVAAECAGMDLRRLAHRTRRRLLPLFMRLGAAHLAYRALHRLREVFRR